jgi:hypothetical protein
LSASSLAVFAAATFAVALELNCFAVVALVLCSGFVALLASGVSLHKRRPLGHCLHQLPPKNQTDNFRGWYSFDLSFRHGSSPVGKGAGHSSCISRVCNKTQQSIRLKQATK